MANIKLLDQALAAIDADPASWNQKNYATRTKRTACGTAYCLAGHVGLLGGGVPEFIGNYQITGWMIFGGNKARLIHLYAQEALDLTELQAVALFDGCNTREDLQRIRDALAADADYED